MPCFTAFPSLPSSPPTSRTGPSSGSPRDLTRHRARPRRRRAPRHLGPSDASFYAEVASGFDLSLPEEAALLQVAETLVVLTALDAEIRETDPIVNGRPSPLIIEARQQRAILTQGRSATGAR